MKNTDQIIKEGFEEGKCMSLSNIQVGLLTQSVVEAEVTGMLNPWVPPEKSDLPEAEQSKTLLHLKTLVQARPLLYLSRSLHTRIRSCCVNTMSRRQCQWSLRVNVVISLFWLDCVTGVKMISKSFVKTVFSEY